MGAVLLLVKQERRGDSRWLRRCWGLRIPACAAVATFVSSFIRHIHNLSALLQEVITGSVAHPAVAGSEGRVYFGPRGNPYRG